MVEAPANAAPPHGDVWLKHDGNRKGFPMDMAAVDTVREQIIEALKTCYDPEIPVNIYELGLIYNVDVSPEGAAHVQMTLTSPNCPAAQSLPGEVEVRVKGIPEVTDALVEVVWDPPWNMDMMSEDAKLELGIDY
jgi:FeS assembly SUF system protein